MSLLLDLPAELLLRVTEYSTFDSYKSLSLTNSRLHKFLEPVLFACLKVINRKEDEDVLKAVIEKYGRHVAKLNFDLHLLPDMDDGNSLNESEGSLGNQDNSSQLNCLTLLAKEVLGGQLCHNVSDIKFTVIAADNFDGTYWDEGGTIYMHAEPEMADDVFEEEQNASWRGTMNEAYQALATREGVKTLRLCEVVPRECSTFYTQTWRAFLHNIKDFNIKLWGGDNGAGWHSNTQPGYDDFILKMDQFFFGHLDSAERVTFIADDQNPIGMEPNFHHSPTPIRHDAMPKLKHLVMENFFIDPALANLIKSHSQQLESLTLKNCFGSPDISTAHPYTWAEFLRTIQDTKPILQSLTITNVRAPLTREEEFWRAYAEDEAAPFQPREEEATEILRIRERLRNDPKLRVWPYVYLDDKYGMVFHDEDENVTAFEAGADQREYEVLMRVVNANRKTRERV
ncbi:hypothetical protein CB0940_08924 [Cercospora beticola]|uniref:F-box domain-containing protein n=1 Tax=Cercospora beticola TaxID=122368 RepID=A0A2G5HPJ7_CERBT|nr:hypothetical protein CB0940_08924 [Cercospora beticola]PIA94465.1 hypothetical protein CB0940_08924 [Cercospora beticola]WPB05519.1 hypothetical protein RHO25_010172 [Cercospora beticola]